MKRRDFIAGIAVLAGAIGIGKSVIAEESFLEKLKRLGCTVTSEGPIPLDGGLIEYKVAISHPSGFRSTTWSDSYARCMSTLERNFDRFWELHGPKTA